jgi:hypothetical protein
MNHQEKVQMLDEVQEIRNLIMKLEKETNTGAKGLGTAGVVGGGTGTIQSSRRVLDLF